jgi:hypothetical protein
VIAPAACLPGRDRSRAAFGGAVERRVFGGLGVLCGKTVFVAFVIFVAKRCYDR